MGLTHSIPTLALGMYRHNNNQRSCTTNRAPSTASGGSLKSHMTEISKTMLQLTKLIRKCANTQQQNHQTMVTVERGYNPGTPSNFQYNPKIVPLDDMLT